MLKSVVGILNLACAIIFFGNGVTANYDDYEYSSITQIVSVILGIIELFSGIMLIFY